MTSNDQDVDLEERLREARGRLAAGPAATGLPEGRGEGSAADGWVRVVAGGDRLAEIVLNPRTMRWDAAELARHLAPAINAALADALARAPEATDEVIDPAVLAGRLREVQDEGMRMMAVIGQGLDAAVAKIRERASMSDPPGVHVGLDALLEQVRAMASSASTGHTAEEDEPSGTGRDASGQVVAVARPGGRVESLDIGARALRAGSAGVADAVVTAVNAALDDLRDRAAERSGAMDRGELLGRAQELQDRTLGQMRDLTGSLAAMMASIRRP